jgi:phosphatidylglycerol:prolipoprotein diacylglycerol transferase
VEQIILFAPPIFMLQYLKLGENLIIPSYNLLIGLGIALSMLFLQYQYDFKKTSEDYKHKIHTSILISIIVGFIGAFAFDAYSKQISFSFDNLKLIGLTFLGGFMSGLCCLVICLKIFSISILKTLNTLTIPFCISHFLGRIGCFLAGCCYGSPTESFLGVKFPKNSIPYFHYNQNIEIHPTQLYESFFVFVLFIILIIFNPISKFKYYLLSYSVFRFFIEFIRADDRGMVLNQNFLSPSQILTFLIVLFLLIMDQIYNTKRSTRIN